MATLISCPRCGGPLASDRFNSDALTSCPQCRAESQVEIFPAFFRRPESDPRDERIVVEGESSCFYHPQKKAVVPCEACGRFLCALCDVELEGQHLCPNCLESGKRKGTLQSLENSRMLYNRQALVLSMVPLFITGLAAIYMVVRYWKAPPSLVSPARWAMPTALVLGSLQVIGLALSIIAAIAE
jgi:DNA-directed RNA polymerase subunit M/transcription elongation factor TFIIS